ACPAFAAPGRETLFRTCPPRSARCESAARGLRVPAAWHAGSTSPPFQVSENHRSENRDQYLSAVVTPGHASAPLISVLQFSISDFCYLLSAERALHVGFRAAFIACGSRSGNPRARRTFFDRLNIEAAGGGKPFRTAQRFGGGTAVGGAVRGSLAALVPGDDVRVGQQA